MLDPRASAHPISDQAELLVCVACSHVWVRRYSLEIRVGKKLPPRHYLTQALTLRFQRLPRHFAVETADRARLVLA
jgi:hypothetical protein